MEEVESDERYHFHLRGSFEWEEVLGSWGCHLEAELAMSHLETMDDFQQIVQSRMKFQLKNSWVVGVVLRTRKRS